MIFFMLFSVLILLCIALIIHKGAYMAPGVGICAGFVVAILCAIYNMFRWDIQLHLNTYLVIISGLIIFLIVSYLGELLYKEKNDISDIKIDYSSSLLMVENWKIWFMIGIVIVISIFYLKEVIRIVGYYHSNISWTLMMYYFRQYVSYGQSTMTVSMVIEQSYQMINMMGYVCIYILVHNYILSGKIQINLLVLCLFTLFSSFLNSSRLEIIRYPIATVTIYFILMNRKNNWQTQFNIKFLIKIIIGFVVVCCLFVLLKQVSGRIDDRDPFYYLTYYLGQSIHNLDEFLQERHTRPLVFGEETFYGWNHFLWLITKKQKYNYIIHKEFRYNDGESIGNVYTVFRAYIHDFGYIGLIILTIIFSVIINYMYIRLKNKTIKNGIMKFDFELLLYSYLVYCVYVAFYANYFFTYIVSVRIVKLCIAFKVWEVFLTRIKIKI